MYKKEVLFNFLSELSHLILVSTSYNPNMPHLATNRRSSIFLNIYENNKIQLNWYDNTLETTSITFPLNNQSNIDLMKFLIKQEEISNEFQLLVDKNIVRLSEKLEVDLPEVLSKEKIETIKKNKP